MVEELYEIVVLDFAEDSGKPLARALNQHHNAVHSNKPEIVLDELLERRYGVLVANPMIPAFEGGIEAFLGAVREKRSDLSVVIRCGATYLSDGGRVLRGRYAGDKNVMFVNKSSVSQIGFEIEVILGMLGYS